MAGSIANLSATLRWDLDDFQRGTAKVEGAFTSIIGLAGRMADAVAAAGKKMTIGMTLPLAGIAALTVKAASDAEELQSAFDHTFGRMSSDMNRWAETAGNAMSRSTQSMQEGALAFGQLFRAAAPTEAAAARLSQQFTELAQDSASFFNTDFDTAMGKIRSGLTGEAEPLRAFGVFLSEAAVKAKGLEMGLVESGQELNEYGKIMARTVLISEGLSAAQGDIDRTSDSLANRFRALKENIRELAVEIGEKLEPTARRLVTIAEGMVRWFRELPDGVKSAALGFGIFLAVVGPIVVVLSTLATLVLPLLLVRFLAMRGAMGPFLAILTAIMNPIGAMIVGLGKLVMQFGLLSKAAGLAGRAMAFMLGPVGLLIAGVALLSSTTETAAQKLKRLSDEADDAEQVADDLEKRLAQATGATDDFGSQADAATGKIHALTDSMMGAIKAARGLIATLNQLQITKLLNERVEIEQEREQIKRNARHPELTQTRSGAALERAGQGRSVRFSTDEQLDQLDRRYDALGRQINARLKAKLAGVDLDTPGGVEDPRNYALEEDAKKAKAGRAGKGRVGRSGRSPEEIAERFEDELASYYGQTNSALMSMAKSAEERAELELRGVELAEMRTLAAISFDEEYSQAQKDTLSEVVKGLAAIEREAIEFQKRLEIERETAEMAQVAFENKRELLRLDADMADTQGDRKRLALEILDLEQEYRRNQVEMVLASATASDAEKRRAQAILDSLSAIESGERSSANRANETNVERYLRDLNKTPAQINEAIDDIKIDGLESLNDQLVDAIMNVKSFGDVFKNVINQIVADLIRMQLRKLIIAPLAEAMGLGSGTGGGGGGLFAALGSVLGLASGKPTNLLGGTPYNFATGGSFAVQGHPGIDRNLLSLNGSPVARVSSGEIVNVQRNAQQSRTNVQVVPSPYFDVVVDGRIMSAAPAIASAGSSMGMQRMARMQSRQL